MVAFVARAPASVSSDPFVQKVAFENTGILSGTSPAFASPTTAGNLLILTVRHWALETNTSITVSDSYGNTWQPDGKQYAETTDSASEIWSCALAPGKAGSGHTVTVASASGNANSSIHFEVSEFNTGAVNTVVPLDVTAVAQSFSSPIIVTTPTTAQPRELLVACLDSDTDQDPGNLSDPPTINGSTAGIVTLAIEQTSTAGGQEACYFVTSAVNTYAVQWSFTPSVDGGACGAVVATYKLS